MDNSKIVGTIITRSFREQFAICLACDFPIYTKKRDRKREITAVTCPIMNKQCYGETCKEARKILARLVSPESLEDKDILLIQKSREALMEQNDTYLERILETNGIAFMGNYTSKVKIYLVDMIVDDLWEKGLLRHLLNQIKEGHIK